MSSCTIIRAEQMRHSWVLWGDAFLGARDGCASSIIRDMKHSKLLTPLSGRVGARATHFLKCQPLCKVAGKSHNVFVKFFQKYL